MEATARLYNCARCHRQVVICSHCDRGQRYCAGGCAPAARTVSIRQAGQRYQNSRRGRHRHAERQRRYRQRQSEKVTHQGSPVIARDVSLSHSPCGTTNAAEAGIINAVKTLICHFCARLCSVFLRQGFKRRRSDRRTRYFDR